VRRFSLFAFRFSLRRGTELVLRNYEDLEVWQRAHLLTIKVYRSTEQFPRSEVFGLTSQIRRASSSIGANLAEGCGRWSDAELARYVQIASGSASELQNHLRLSKDLELLGASEYDSLLKDLTSVRQMLSALLQRLRGVRSANKSTAGSLIDGGVNTAP
jgi:four helix bundle protein